MTQKNKSFKFILFNLLNDFEFLPKNRFSKFDYDYKLTVGVNVYNAKFKIDNLEKLISFWDVALGERFYSSRPLFYEQCSGIIIFSSFSEPAKSQFNRKIIPEITDHLKSRPGNQIPILIFFTSATSLSSEELNFYKSEFGVQEDTISVFRIEGESHEFIEEQIKKALKKILQDREKNN